MMKISDLLLVEGTSNITILCYGLFNAADLDQAVSMVEYEAAVGSFCVYPLMNDGWPGGLLLSETTLPLEYYAEKEVIKALRTMLGTSLCRAAFCMYDGVFGGYKDVFGSDSASQTYAFCFVDEEPVLAPNSLTLESEAWLSAILDARTRVLT
jgi:hypothetical protein